MHTTACQSGDTLTWAKEIDMLGGRICGISWIVIIALLKQFPLFIYLFIHLQNHILESLSRNEKFRASVFLCIKCTAGKQKKNNMWFIGILICFKPAKPTEFPRQPLRVKAHQRKKMKKKKKKEFHVTWGAFTVASEATVGRCTEKMSLPPCSVSAPVVLSNSDWSKRAEIKPMLEASLGIMRFMNRPRVCVALES